MSFVSSWILSIVGVVIIGVIIDLIMPDGQMSKYIKGIVAIVTVLVIVLPLPKLANKEINFDFNSSIVLDSELIYSINENKIEQLNILVEKRLEENGYKNVDVFINADLYSYELKIEGVFVDLSQAVINEEMANIDKYTTDIKGIVREVLEVEEEDILIDGR